LTWPNLAADQAVEDQAVQNSIQTEAGRNKFLLGAILSSQHEPDYEAQLDAIFDAQAQDAANAEWLVKARDYAIQWLKEHPGEAIKSQVVTAAVGIPNKGVAGNLFRGDKRFKPFEVDGQRQVVVGDKRHKSYLNSWVLSEEYADSPV
jgi:hypothetical protein